MTTINSLLFVTGNEAEDTFIKFPLLEAFIRQLINSIMLI